MIARGPKLAGEVQKRWNLIVWTASFIVALALVACAERPQLTSTPTRFARVTGGFDAVTTPTSVADFAGRAVWAGQCFAQDPYQAWGAALLLDTAAGSLTVLGGPSLPSTAYTALDRAAIVLEADTAPRSLVDTATLVADDGTRRALLARTAGGRPDRLTLSYDFELRRGRSASGAPVLFLKGGCALEGGCPGNTTGSRAAKGDVLLACFFTHDTDRSRDSEETRSAVRDMSFLMGLQ